MRVAILSVHLNPQSQGHTTIQGKKRTSSNKNYMSEFCPKPNDHFKGNTYTDHQKAQVMLSSNFIRA